MMNLLAFVRLHRGLTAARIDWKLAFGSSFERLLTGGKGRFLPGRPVRRVMDPCHRGEWLLVETPSLCGWNPAYLEHPHTFDNGQELDSLRLPLRLFAQKVARALSLPVRGVAVLDEYGGLAILHSQPAIFLSLSMERDDMNRHLAHLQNLPGRSLLLTLSDTEEVETPSPLFSHLIRRPLRHFINDEMTHSPHLHPWAEGRFASLFEALQRGGIPHDPRSALCRRPQGATYRELTLVLHTSDTHPARLPEDDELEFRYRAQRPIRKKARDLSDFVTRQGDLNAYWQLLRLHALGHGTLTEPHARKRHAYAERSRILRRILNMLADMPPGAEAFHRGAEKYSVTSNMSMQVRYRSPSVRLSAYNTRSLDGVGF